MTLFDGSYTTFYQSAIVHVNIALSCTVFKIFDVEEYRDLEISVRVTHPANLCTIGISLTSPVPDSQPTVTELFQSPLYGSGTVFLSIITSAPSLPVFCSYLKTYLFELCYP